MNLRTKFNLLMISVLLIGFLVIFWHHKSTVNRELEKQIDQQNKLLFNTTTAFRDYHNEQVRELLLANVAQSFTPQAVASYALSEIFTNNGIHSTVSYKTAIEQAEVERYTAKAWERKIIDYFKQNPNQTNHRGNRADAQSNHRFYAEPIRQDQQIIGAHIISTDINSLRAQSDTKVINFAILLVTVFIVLTVIFNLLLHFMVIKPVQLLSDQAETISKGDLTVAELSAQSTDEIGRLAESFNRMLRSLKTAMNMLGQ